MLCCPGPSVRQVERSRRGAARRGDDLVAAEAGSRGRSAGRRPRRTGSCRRHRSSGTADLRAGPPQLSTFARQPPVGPAAAPAATRRALFGSSAPATGLGDQRRRPSSMPVLTPDVTTGLPAKRPRVADADVGGEDDGVGGGDLGRRERRRAGRALRSRPSIVCPPAFGGGLEGLGRHVGVGDAGRARGDRDEVERALGGRRCGAPWSSAAAAAAAGAAAGCVRARPRR